MPLTPEQLREKLSAGVIGFPVTVFKPDLSLDLEGYRESLRAMIAHPLAAVVAAGGTGELYSLTPEEQLAIVQATVEETAGKTPVLAGVGFNQPLAVNMARKAAEAGADGILALPPYYPNADLDGLFAYYESIAQATSLGLLIYSRDWVNPDAAFVKRLATLDTLIAWKDGQAGLRKYQMIMNALDDRLLWIGGAGDDMVPGYYSIGCRTYTSSIATISPRLSLRLHELAAAGEREELTRLMNELVVPLYALRTHKKGYEVSVMKAAMDMIGLKGGPVRPPLPSVTSEDLQALQGQLSRWKDWLIHSHHLRAPQAVASMRSPKL